MYNFIFLMFRKVKSIEIENRLVVTQDRVCAMEIEITSKWMRDYYQGDGNVLKRIYVDGCTTQ